MIGISLWVVDTSRISGVALGLVAVTLLMFGRGQEALVVAMLWAVPVVVSAVVLLLGAWIRDGYNKAE